MASELKLLEEEKLLKIITPHILSFHELYMVWLWIIILSIVFMAYGNELSQLIGNPVNSFVGYLDWMTSPQENPLIKKLDIFPKMEGLNNIISPFNQYLGQYLEIGLWLTLVILTALPLAALRIDFTWGPLMIFFGITCVLTAYALDFEPRTTYFISILLSIVALYLVNLYRKAHKFYITDRRIITQARFLNKKYNELSYDKINNVIMEQGLIGRLFNFGTIMPITASGLGMGSDAMAITLGIAGQRGNTLLGAGITGERAIQIPRTKSMYALFGVPKPTETKDLISKHLHDHVQAPYLKKMTQHLHKLTQNKKP